MKNARRKVHREQERYGQICLAAAILWVFPQMVCKMCAVITKHLLNTLCCYASTEPLTLTPERKVTRHEEHEKESRLGFVTRELGHCRAESCKFLPSGSLHRRSGQPEEVADFIHRGKRTELSFLPFCFHAYCCNLEMANRAAAGWLYLTLCFPLFGCNTECTRGFCAAII